VFLEDHPATKRLVELKDKKPTIIEMNIRDESDNLFAKKIQSNHILNRILMIIPPPQKEQAGAFSLAGHDQHSDTQPCQELLKVSLDAS
jgi:hypothetical protein